MCLFIWLSYLSTISTTTTSTRTTKKSGRRYDQQIKLNNKRTTYESKLSFSRKKKERKIGQ